MTGTETTPRDYTISHRWDGKEDDLEVYNLIFDVCMYLYENTVGEVLTNPEVPLVMAIINEWEKKPRSIPPQVISKAYDWATHHETSRIMWETMIPEGYSS